MIRRCFTCKNFSLDNPSDHMYGFCSKFNVPCDGMRHCASHDKLPPKPMAKKEHKPLIYEGSRPTLESEVKTTEETPIESPALQIAKPKITSVTPEDFTKRNILYMRKKGGDKYIKVEDFSTLMDFWGISKSQALDCARYGGNVKGMEFVNRVYRRGIVVIKDNGKCYKYKTVEDAAKREGTSVNSINKCIANNKPDVTGKSFMREWLLEDVPYKERPVSTRGF